MNLKRDETASSQKSARYDHQKVYIEGLIQFILDVDGEEL
jgi:hypothetical protein